MYIKQISILVFLIFGLFFYPYISSAATENRPDPLAEELQNLLKMPEKVIIESDNGDIVEEFRSPDTPNSVWTIKKKDGSIIQFTKSSNSFGWSAYSFTENGKTTTATIDKDGNIAGDPSATSHAAVASSTTKPDNGKLTIITSEKVPGASCICYINNQAGWSECPIGTKVENRKYQCTTNTWMLGFQEVFAKIIRYIINIVLLLWVLAVVGLGIAWSFAGGDDVKAKSTLKTWAINIVVWLFILFMFRYILLFLAPWIYR